MEGLLLKDIYVTMKQSKILLGIMVIFAVIPFISVGMPDMMGYAVFYAAVMVISALSYDERAKWDKMAAMMPYSPKEVVLSKYLLSYVLVGGVAFLIIISRAIYTILGMEGDLLESTASVLLICGIAFLWNAVNLPFMFKLGVEKGRMIMIFFFIAVMMGTMGLVTMSFGEGEISLFRNLPEFSNVSIGIIIAVGVGIVIAANLISIKISEKCYIGNIR